MSTTWRVIVFLSVAFNIIAVASVVYGLYAYGQNIEAFERVQNWCSKKGFDSIASAAAIGRLDIVSLILTFLGILLAIMALGGFWYFRREALEVAGAEARSIAPGALKDYMDNNGTNLIVGCLDHGEFLATLQLKLASFGIEDTEKATLVDEDPNWKEQTNVS